MFLPPSCFLYLYYVILGPCSGRRSEDSEPVFTLFSLCRISVSNIAPKDPENSENTLFCVRHFSFQRICLFTEGMFTTSFEANHRDVISVLPISCFCPGRLNGTYNLPPCLWLFCQLSFPLSWGGLRCGFSFLAPTALLWQEA